MKRLAIFYIFLMMLASCGQRQDTFGEKFGVTKLGIPVKIEYFQAKDSLAFQHADTTTFIISETDELNEAIGEINEASAPSPWKGAGWHKIKVHFKDTVLEINTNNQVIGLRASGVFYELDKSNFLTRRLRAG